MSRRRWLRCFAERLRDIHPGLGLLSCRHFIMDQGSRQMRTICTRTFLAAFGGCVGSCRETSRCLSSFMTREQQSAFASGSVCKSTVCTTHHDTRNKRTGGKFCPKASSCLAHSRLRTLSRWRKCNELRLDHQKYLTLIGC